MATTTAGRGAGTIATGATTAGSAKRGHVLPQWFEVLQNHVFLSFLILANMYILGTLATTGWVDNLETPTAWGWFHGVGVVLLFCGGALMAGISLRVSIKAAAALEERRYLLGLFNLLGALVFAAIEVWASLSERSTHLTPTPADTAVLALLDVHNLPVSPTVIAVACMLPLSAIFWGFSQQEPVVKSAEQIDAETAQQEARLRAQGRIERVRAEEAARVRATRVEGMALTAAAAKAGTISVLGRQSSAETAAGSTDPDNGTDGPHNGGGMPLERGVAGRSAGQGFAGLVRIGAADGSAQQRATLNRLPLHKRVAASGVLTAGDLVEALDIGESQARAYLQEVPGVTRRGAHKTAALEAPVAAVLAYFASRGTHAGNAHYRTLQEKLNPRGKGRQHSGHAGATANGRTGLSVVSVQPTALRAVGGYTDDSADDSADAPWVTAEASAQ